MHEHLIAEAKRLCEAATPGPWKVGKQSPSGAQNVGALSGLLTAQTTNESNADFIARSRTLITELVAALEEQHKMHWISVNAGADAIRQLRERAEKAETERDQYKAALQNWHEDGVYAPEEEI